MNDARRLRVLMLGWEYPPHISGGLGTACEGLTKSLAPLNVEIDFVVPALYGVEDAPHMRLLSPELMADTVRYSRRPADDERRSFELVPGESYEGRRWDSVLNAWVSERDGVQTLAIPAHLAPYMTADDYD